jgi:hypothetical protein
MATPEEETKLGKHDGPGVFSGSKRRDRQQKKVLQIKWFAFVALLVVS